MSLEKNCNVLTLNLFTVNCGNKASLGNSTLQPPVKWMGSATHTIRTENPVSVAIRTDSHRRRTGDVNGRGGSAPQLSPSYSGHLRPKDDEPLTPNHLLLQTGSATPAPGVFVRTIVMFVDVGGKYSGWHISSGDVGLESIRLLFFHDRNGQPNEAIFSSATLFLSRARDIRETIGRRDASATFFPTVEILFDKWK